MHGIIYIALGDKYFDMALGSIESIYNHYSGTVPLIQILSDRDISPNVLINNSAISVKKIGFEYPDDPGIATAYLKTRLHHLSPFDTTLYLDCDVMAVDDISGIWSHSSKHIAVATAYNPLRESPEYRDPECEYTQRVLGRKGYDQQFNTGVFLFNKSPRMRLTFDAWKSEWDYFQKHENMAFNRLIANGMRVDQLPKIYNDFYPYRFEQSKLVHYIGNFKDKLDV